jgi:hypothetical protein
MNEIREALDSAFEKSGGSESAPAQEMQSGPSIEAVGTDDAPAPGEMPSEAAPETTPTTAPAKDPKTGKFVPKGAAPAVAAKPTVPPVTAPPATAAPVVAGTPHEPAKPTAPAVKAPQSWRPEVREKWAGLPPEVQAEVARIDREVRQTMQDSAEAKKSWSAFQQTVGPYEALIRAEGSEPLKAVGSLLQTAAALRTAPPAMKAQVVAKLIQQYAVPVDALDAALSGQAPAAQTQGAAQTLDPEALLQQAEQRVFQRIQQQRQQSVMAKAQQDAEAFVNSGEAEFLEDVRGIMANMLDSAGRSGIPLTLKDAYDRACLLSPEVSRVMEQRKAAQAATVTQAATQRARDAASSVRSQPAAPPMAAESTDLRGLLERNWTKASGR